MREGASKIDRSVGSREDSRTQTSGLNKKTVSEMLSLGRGTVAKYGKAKY